VHVRHRCEQGACLAKELSDRGHRLVRVWSDGCPDAVKAHTKKGMEVSYVGEVQVVGDDLAGAVAALRKFAPIRDVMVGCETGVLCTDRLAAALGARGNGDAQSTLRRNKFAQIEAVRGAGLDAPLQALASCAADVDAFLESSAAILGTSASAASAAAAAAAAAAAPTPFKAVVKPVEGAGSDGVSICDSPEAVRAAYGALEGTRNLLGLVNYDVLLQVT
jgi:hypothetical protein